MKSIVAYYSNKGSNRYLANKIAQTMQCDIIEIKPKLNAHLLMLMGLNFGNRKIKTDLSQYDQVILCGPIWMGKLIVPLKNFIRSNLNSIKQLVFVTCCASSFEAKDKKFGHGFVFKKVEALTGDKCKHCEALPITMVLPEDQKENGELVMKTRLSDENFKGEIQMAFDRFIEKIKN